MKGHREVDVLYIDILYIFCIYLDCVSPLMSPRTLKELEVNIKGGDFFRPWSQGDCDLCDSQYGVKANTQSTAIIKDSTVRSCLS